MNKPNKMKCAHVQEDAVALLGVELTDGEEQMVYSHLSDCPHCRDEFRRDRKTWQAINAGIFVQRETWACGQCPYQARCLRGAQ